jgi:hypothetical protein
MRELRSITCAKARADALGRPLSEVGACSVPCSIPDILKNRFPDRFRRARISSLLQLAFLQANPPVAEHRPNKTPSRLIYPVWGPCLRPDFR